MSVKAAVLPFHRFPGSDPVLGPEMRATGEVMASAADLPTAFAKAERAAGRQLPTSGTVFLSVRDADKPALVPVAAALAGLGFALVATEGTAATLEAAGLEVERVRKMIEEGAGATVVDLVRRGRCDLVINTPQGYGARTDGYLIREAALVNRVPCITTISGAAAAVHAIASARTDVAALAAGADRSLKRARLSVLGSEPVGPYTLLRVERGGLDAGIPGQFFMLEAPGRLLPRPMSLCLAPAGELGFLIDPIGPGTRALCAARPGRRDRRARPARERLRARGEAAARRRRHRRRALSVSLRVARRAAGACSASAARGTPRRRRSSRTRRSCSSRRTSPRQMPSGHDVLACGPEPMLEAVRRLAPDAQLAWEAPMACGFGACYGCVVEIDGRAEAPLRRGARSSAARTALPALAVG